MSEGFVYVASRKKLFYELAILSAQSLKDIWPQANVTLFTHKSFVDDRAQQLFNNVITDIPVHGRAKMWCMARTPYDVTYYTDVDSQIVHKDIRKVFSELGDYDMYFCGSIWYTTGNHKWAYIDRQQQIPVKYHGAVCCYKKTDLTLDFMQTWFDDYIKQRWEPWPHRFAHKDWQQFDMFTLWSMTNPNTFPKYQRFADLKIKTGHKRFNGTCHDQGKGKDIEYGDKSPVIYQIDKDTWTEMYVWKDIVKRINDERRTPKEYETGTTTIAFD